MSVRDLFQPLSNIAEVQQATVAQWNAAFSSGETPAVTSVTAGSLSLYIAPTTGAVVVNLAPVVSVETLNVETDAIVATGICASLTVGSLQYPTIDAPAGYTVQTDGAGTLSLQAPSVSAGVNTLTSTDPNIVVDAPTGNVNIALAPTLNLGTVNANSIQCAALSVGSPAYAFPAGVGTPGQALVVSATPGTLEFSSLGSSVTSVTAGPSNNLIVDTTIGVVTLDLATEISLNSVITDSLTTGGVTYPTATPTAGQVLAITGPASASWVDAEAIPPVTYELGTSFNVGSGTSINIAFIFTKDPNTGLISVDVNYASYSTTQVQIITANELITSQPINDTVNGNATWFDGLYNYQFATTSGYQLSPGGMVLNKYLFYWTIDGSGFIHCGTTAAAFASGSVWWACAGYSSLNNPTLMNFTGGYQLSV